MPVMPYFKGGADVAITDGGTDASTAGTALTNLGGLDEPAHDLLSHAGLPGIPDELQITTRQLTFNNTTGGVSTGSLGFTPIACIAIGALKRDSVNAGTISIGFATSTSNEMGVAHVADNNGSDNDDLVCYDVNDIIGVLETNRSVGALGTSFTAQTGTPNRLNVTAFSSSGITLDPQVADGVTGRVFLLIFGR